MLDRMREGADRLRNNTNSFLSGELLGLVPVRISVSGETDEGSMRIRPAPRSHSSVSAAAAAAAAAVGAIEGNDHIRLAPSSHLLDRFGVSVYNSSHYIHG